LSHIRQKLSQIIACADNELSMLSRELFTELLEEFHKLDARVDHYDRKIKQAVQANPICQRLMQVEGVGPLTATMMWATITEPTLFKNGRGVAALLGLVPKQHASGNKTMQLGISKRGDPYLRMLLIHGARTVVQHAGAKKTKRQQWIMEKVARCGVNKTAVAVANKNARILWALMVKGETYQVAC
jgi:transposase